MKDLFLNIIERVKAEGDLIAIRTDRDETFRFAAGYVEDEATNSGRRKSSNWI